MSHEPAPGAGQPSGHRSSCGHGHGWRPTEKALPLWDGAVSSGRGLPVKSGPARRAPGPGSGMAPRGTKPHQNPEATRRRCMSCRGHAAVTMQLAIARPLETGQDLWKLGKTPHAVRTRSPRETLPRLQRPCYSRGAGQMTTKTGARAVSSQKLAAARRPLAEPRPQDSAKGRAAARPQRLS